MKTSIVTCIFGIIYLDIRLFPIVSVCVFCGVGNSKITMNMYMYVHLHLTRVFLCTVGFGK